MDLFDPSLSPIVGHDEQGFGDYQSTSLTPGFQRLSTGNSAPAHGNMSAIGQLDLGGESIAELCSQLRKLARDALEKRIHESSAFFSEKLVTLSQAEPEDVLLLAQAYYQGKDYRRAVHVLDKHGLLSPPESSEPLGLVQLPLVRLDSYFLGAQCLAVDKPEECLQLLEQVMTPWEDEEEELPAPIENLIEEQQRQRQEQQGAVESFPLSGGDSQAEGGGNGARKSSGKDVLRILGALCCLRGKVYASQDNRARAVVWLKHALRVDIYCSEALEFLVDRKLLSKNEEKHLLEHDLVFGPGDGWLRALFGSRLCLQDPEQVLKDKFRTLEESYGLGENPSVLTAKAEVAYYQQDSQTAYQLAKKVFQYDPYNYSCLPIYLCAMSDLGLKSELYYVAHQLVEAHSKHVISWYAVGCYYSTVKKFDAAQRYFHKATKLDPRFAPAWIGFGNAFAAQDESDQAMAAYRTASRLTSSHLPNLYIGIEYVRTNNAPLAHRFLRAAQELCDTDPLLYNELGVVLFRLERYDEAAEACQKALDLCKAYNGHLSEKWDGTLVNLGHCHRKRGQYAEAIKYYEMAIGLCPRRASSFAALAFAHHLQGSLDLAIEYYHRALGLKPDDSFSSEMLFKALEDVLHTDGPGVMGVVPSMLRQYSSGRRSSRGTAKGYNQDDSDMMDDDEGDEGFMMMPDDD